MERIYRAVKYIRTSSPDDDLHFRDSAANQSSLIDRILQAHPEILTVAERIDNGYSGVFFDRPAFNEMVEDIKAGHVDCVVVKDLSRLGRNYVETGKCLRDLFRARGVRFISIDDNIDTIMMNEFDNMIIMIKNIFSEQYSRDVSIKTRSSLDAKRRQGKYVGAVPIYGYQRSCDNKHRFSLDPNTYTVVQSIFNMKLQGISAAGIASELNSAGILSPIAYKRKHGIAHPTGGFADKGNAHWSATTILRILRNENYTGILVQGRKRSINYKTKKSVLLDEREWARTENAHHPIVSKMDYAAVQRVLALDTRTAPRHSRAYIFSGLLTCGCCGGSMTRKTVKTPKRQYIYHYCPTGKRNGCHSAYMIAEQTLLNLVTQKVKERIEKIQELSFSLSADNFGEMAEKERVRQIIKSTQYICDMRGFVAHLHGSLTHGIIDDMAFKALKDYYDDEIAQQTAEVSALRHKPDDVKRSFNDGLTWMDNFLQFVALEELDRSAVIRTIQDIRIVGKEDVSINFVSQSEYEWAVQCLQSGGGRCGEKEPKKD